MLPRGRHHLTLRAWGQGRASPSHAAARRAAPAAAAAPPSVHNCRPLEVRLPPPCRSPQALLADLQRNDAGFRANRARYLEFTDENGNTPLTLAAARGHLGCVKLVSGDGRLPLRLRAAAHVAVVKGGAFGPGACGLALPLCFSRLLPCMPCSWAVRRHRSHAAAASFSAGLLHTPHHRSPRPSSTFISPLQLLQYGANIHHVNSKADGGSALHEAVAHKHEAVVELLLAHGGNPFVENIKASGAGWRGQEAGALLAALLLACRAKVDSCFHSRLHAVGCAKVECQLYLLPAGLHCHGHCLLHPQRAAAAPAGAVRPLCGLAAHEGGCFGHEFDEGCMQQPAFPMGLCNAAMRHARRPCITPTAPLQC